VGVCSQVQPGNVRSSLPRAHRRFGSLLLLHQVSLRDGDRYLCASSPLVPGLKSRNTTDMQGRAHVARKLDATETIRS